MNDECNTDAKTPTPDYMKQATRLWKKFKDGVKIFEAATGEKIKFNDEGLRVHIRGTKVRGNLQDIVDIVDPTLEEKVMLAVEFCSRDAGVVAASLAAAKEDNTITCDIYDKAQVIVAKMHPLPKESKSATEGIEPQAHQGRLCG